MSRRPRARLLVVWSLLGALLAVIAVTEYRERSGAAPRDGEDARRLLPVPADQLGALEIAEAGRLHRFERDATGTWFYHGAHTAATAAHTHTPDPALAERIARAVAAFGRARIERQFVLEGDGSVYGVTAPEVVVLAYQPGQAKPIAQYAVGGIAPDTASRYVVMVGRPGVVTIPDYQIANLRTLVHAASSSGPASGTAVPGANPSGPSR